MAVNPYAAPSADLNTGIAADAAPPAGRGARFAANLIDQILFWIPMSIGMGVGGKGGAGIGLAIGTLLALALLIYQIVKAASTGQTLAKKWLGIKVVKQDGSPVDGVTIIVMRGLVGQVLLAVIPL
ncbi:MAG TPA: RDD family protein, partial [Polyangia bacterium]|nr:RDD family protein [Polyangia bacterium]